MFVVFVLVGTGTLVALTDSAAKTVWLRKLPDEIVRFGTLFVVQRVLGLL
jgi:hypothetical protein